MTSDIIGVLAAVVALPGGLRWLRIAQREHYIAGSVTRFAVRWWVSRPPNMMLGLLLVASVVAAWAGLWEGAAASAAVSLVAPLGLSYRGRTSKLSWTRRLRTLTAITAVLVAAI